MAIKLHNSQFILLFLQEASCTKLILPHTSRGEFIQEFGLEDDIGGSFQTGQTSKVESLPKRNVSKAPASTKHLDKMLVPKKEVEDNTKYSYEDVKEEDFKKENESYKSEYGRPVRLLKEILEDFCWPEGQQGQNYHRMRWRIPRGKVRGCPFMPQL